MDTTPGEEGRFSLVTCILDPTCATGTVENSRVERPSAVGFLSSPVQRLRTRAYPIPRTGAFTPPGDKVSG